jgi:hypothetical protein
MFERKREARLRFPSFSPSLLVADYKREAAELSRTCFGGWVVGGWGMDEAEAIRVFEQIKWGLQRWLLPVGPMFKKYTETSPEKAP